MGPFVSSHGMKYILVGFDYELKWVEEISLPNNEGKSVTAFLKRISSVDVAHLGPLSMMVSLTFLTYC